MMIPKVSQIDKQILFILILLNHLILLFNTLFLWQITFVWYKCSVGILVQTLIYSIYLTQQVKINVFLSDTFFVFSDVSQSSHLFLFLFTIFIIDLRNYFKFCDYLLFADDLKIYVFSIDNFS